LISLCRKALGFSTVTDVAGSDHSPGPYLQVGAHAGQARLAITSTQAKQPLLFEGEGTLQYQRAQDLMK
jgi:hypothetical protein